MLGDNIIRIRKSRGVTLIRCAKMIGISPGYLSDIENNIKKNPSMEILGKIASVLGIEARELLSTEEKLDFAIGSLDEIDKTISQYYLSKNDENSNQELQNDAETNLLMNKIKKLSEKNRKIVETLINQLESD